MQELGSAAAIERARDVYDLGHTAIFAATSDPRFHYLMYVPRQVAAGRPVELLVAVHGTGRTSAIDFRDGFAEFGRWNDCAILCPIFPINVLGTNSRSGYKYLVEGGIRYDQVLLSMVEEVAAKYGQDWSSFALFGYSGGGQFTHRFAMLHPEKLWAASIGAPGSVTLLDSERDWWVGIRDLPALFGKAFDGAALARLPVQMIVGALDHETWEITHRPGGVYYMDGANDAGETRVDRLQALSRSFEAAGAKVQLDLVPGVSHDRMKVLDAVKGFLSEQLHRRTQKAASR